MSSHIEVSAEPNEECAIQMDFAHLGEHGYGSQQSSCKWW